nr:DUF4097 family beta strand repeat-containing protein [Pontibacillus sp. HN14]
MFIIGIVGTVASLQVTGAFTKETIEVFEEKSFNGSTIDTFHVDTSSADIYIEPSEDQSIYVQWGGHASKGVWEDYELTTKEEGNELSIKLRQKDLLGFQFGLLQRDLKLTVKVPEKLYETINGSSSSGDVVVLKQQAKRLQLKTSSGDIELKEITSSEKLVTRSSSGSIYLTKVSADRIDTDTSSGDVMGKGVNVVDIIGDSSSGTIDYRVLTLKGDLILKTSSGDVHLDFEQVPNSYSIEYQSSSGDERVNLDGVEYDRKAEHEVVGQKGNGDQRIEIHTSSGDFSAQ